MKKERKEQLDQTKKCPWSPEDEREHRHSILEWWCSMAFFEAEDKKKKYSFKLTFTEWNTSKGVGSIAHSTLHDLSNKKNFSYYSKNELKKLESEENCLDISYEDSALKGKYPNYSIYFNDKENDIQFDLKIKAGSLPYQIAQDISNGNIPMGFGCLRYGFIPKCKISGTLKIKGKEQKIQGQGYYEHVWGDFDYEKPLSSFKGITKTIGTYAKLAGWWIKNNKIEIPTSLKFGTENNPLGYDWAWILLDNGWSLFYGNVLFWLMKGPAAGMLIFTKDGETYSLFCDIDFKYNKTRKSKIYDFEYPSEIQITAVKGKEKIQLNCKMITETKEYVAKFLDKKYWKGFVICETPGKVNGTYSDGKKTIKLSGICKIEPQRQISFFGHNTLDVEFLKPPKGIGISLDFESHYFKKQLYAKLQLAPRPKLNFKIKRI